MTQVLDVEFVPEAEMIHLSGSAPGPAGDAGLRLGPGISCRFDSMRIGAVTSCWIDPEAASAVTLSLLFGDHQAQSILGNPERLTNVEVLNDALADQLSRLAVIDLLQNLPMNRSPRSAWAIDQIVVLGRVRSAGLQLPELTSICLEEAVPRLLKSRSADLDTIEVEALLVTMNLLDQSDTRHQELTRLWTGAESAGPAGPIGPALRIGTRSTLGTAGLGDALWMQLPADHFQAGMFAGIVTVETYLHEGTVRLKVTIPYPDGSTTPLFVRCIDERQPGFPVVYTDAMHRDDLVYVSEADSPPGFDMEHYRVEVVSSLAIQVLSAQDHKRVRAEQWALLALAASRSSDERSARRWWYLSSQMYAAAGEIDLAQAAAAALDEDHHQEFWAETERGISPEE